VLDERRAEFARCFEPFKPLRELHQRNILARLALAGEVGEHFLAQILAAADKQRRAMLAITGKHARRFRQFVEQRRVERHRPGWQAGQFGNHFADVVHRVIALDGGQKLLQQLGVGQRAVALARNHQTMA